MSKSIIMVEDDKYVRLNKETGEQLPLYHKRCIRQHNEEDLKQDECFFVFNSFIKKASTIDGIHMKIFFVMCDYVGFTKRSDNIKKIIIDDNFVMFCNESGLKGKIQYIKKRIWELEKSGLIVKHLPNVYYVNPLYAFKGKLKTRNNIVYGDPKQ